ncbi:MAG TPA: hypothetical protein VK525_08205 [Candidatus Saccharimonadales bacterium]|nr:hypothetical protein [Candidatus Saccharimonadales bacterium]
MKTLGRDLLLTVAAALLLGAVPGAGAAGTEVAGFEKLKSLVGHWEAQPAAESKATMDIRLTANGTTVIETFRMLERGTTVEMVTMYYLDGDRLRMTHYCMAGNQPSMTGVYSPETNTMKFEFTGATNLKSADDGHMDHAVYTFTDNNHLKTLWTFRKNQKDTFTEDVTYVRK